MIRTLLIAFLLMPVGAIADEIPPALTVISAIPRETLIIDQVYRTTGYVVKLDGCPVCTAKCPPCTGDHVVISEINKEQEFYSAMGASELTVLVPDVTKFKIHDYGEFTLRVRDSQLIHMKLREVELVEFKRRPDPQDQSKPARTAGSSLETGP
jgi:hypothetical protein